MRKRSSTLTIKIAEQQIIEYKIIVLGDANVGKSSIIERYCKNEFTYNHRPTIGPEFYKKDIYKNGINITLNIWDTAGQERFRSLTSQYYRNADGVILVYDVNDEKTADDLKIWHTGFLIQNYIHTQYYLPSKILAFCRFSVTDSSLPPVLRILLVSSLR